MKQTLIQYVVATTIIPNQSNSKLNTDQTMKENKFCNEGRDIL